MMRALVILSGVAVLAIVGAVLFVYSGIYNIAATEQHMAPVYRVLNVAMRQSIERHSKDIRVPALNERAMVDRGLSLYRAHCVQCHGAPGVAPDSFALGLTPLPANLALTAREWKDPAELYWVVKYGIKMSGMPAWKFRLADADLWAVVAFLNTMPGLSPREYRTMTQLADAATAATMAPGEIAIRYAGKGNAERGQLALQQYACVTCHVIPGVVGARYPVGPSLAGIASRKYLAGVIPNTPENMIRWLRFPQETAPQTAMPDLGVSERDATDIATYLETLQ